jgi:hypothetical protein
MKTRNELELRITEAVDGLLTDTELRSLSEQLQAYPDLRIEWEAQTTPSMLKQVYLDVHPSPYAVTRLREKLRATPQPVWEVELLYMFKRYVLASGILAISLVGALNVMQPSPSSPATEDVVLNEISTLFNTLEQEAQLWVSIDENTSEYYHREN